MQQDEGGDLAAAYDRLQAKNHALAAALRRASDELEKAKGRMALYGKPPLTYATLVRVASDAVDADGVQHATAEVIAGTRRQVLSVAPDVQASRLHPGDTVVINENLVIVGKGPAAEQGPVRTVAGELPGGRLVLKDASGALSVATRSDRLRGMQLEAGERVLTDGAGAIALETLPAPDDRDLVLEETPDVSFGDIGGLDAQLERIHDAVELPCQHRALFARYDLKAPKGVLLYGPPGNGKTMIAKAVAKALADEGRQGVFLSVKGPELLSKYVGESERMIRRVFQRARQRAAEGRQVVVFIDEMDSLLRTRGSGVSSDVETTIVPQFLAEMDGVEELDNVIVIGASNRIDMIDPAVLRPGRLDVKIRVDRPGPEQAQAIVRRYLTDRLPLEDGMDAGTLADMLVRDAFAQEPSRRIAIALDDQGVRFPLYFGDVVSGAALKGIVDKAKTYAVKASIEQGTPVAVGPALLARAVDEQVAESRQAVAGVDAAQWSKTNGVADGHVARIIGQ